MLYCLKNSGRSWYILLASMMVRFDLTVKSLIPALAASTTNHRKSGFISGAPPVRSRVWAEVVLITSRHCNIVARVMISFLSGPASTWQCEQTWLHIYPRFICNISGVLAFKGNWFVFDNFSLNVGKPPF